MSGGTQTHDREVKQAWGSAVNNPCILYIALQGDFTMNWESPNRSANPCLITSIFYFFTMIAFLAALALAYIAARLTYGKVRNRIDWRR